MGVKREGYADGSERQKRKENEKVRGGWIEERKWGRIGKNGKEL